MVTAECNIKGLYLIYEQLDRHPMELTTQEGKNLIDQIDDLKPVSADSVRNQLFAEVYRESPLFRAYHNSEML